MGLKGHAPMLAHVLYQALTKCVWFVREDPCPEKKFAFGTIVDALKCFFERWRACGKYLFVGSFKLRAGFSQMTIASSSKAHRASSFTSDRWLTGSEASRITDRCDTILETLFARH